MKNLRRTARRHVGVNSEIWVDFPPGMKVMTPDGYWGTVTEAEDGPYPGYEQYEITLDGGMGGGTYDSVELTIPCDECGGLFSPLVTEYGPGHHKHVNRAWEGHFATTLGKTAVHKTADEDQCPYDGSDSVMEDGLYTCELGDVWSPDNPAAQRYHGDGPERGKIQPRARRTADMAGIIGGEGDDQICSGCGQAYHGDGCDGSLHDHWTEAAVAAGLHVASDDYPELSEILVERPPLPHSTRVASLRTEAASDEWKNIPGLEFRARGIMVTAFSPEADENHVVAGKISWYPDSGEIWMITVWEPYRRMGLASELLRRAKEVRPDVHHSENLTADGEAWSQAVGSVHEAAMIDPIPEWAIEQQFTQYPSGGPDGISYFKGEIDANLYVDCLLYRKDGQLVGVLNHYPVDMGPEKAGNVLLMVKPEYRRQGIGRALWEEAVRRWGVTKSQDTSPDGAAFLNRMGHLAALQREAALWDRLLEPVADRMLQRQEESGYGSFNPETGEMASYDWCRFRHNSHCFYPKRLDEQATKEAGRAIFVPEDRGFCPREKWDAQRACPAPSEPGPKSGDPNWKHETWQSWADGGQGRYAHLGMPQVPARRVDQSVEDLSKKEPIKDPEGDEFRTELTEMVTERRMQKNPYVQSALHEGEFGFHLTATWRDVQAKAKTIRSEGHVRIISASVEYLVGEVKGDHNIYQTSLMREPGTKRVAMWECGCAWAAYSWGRSGRWKKFEGRMCSHALALNYEAQSRGWAGGAVSEDRVAPDWRGRQKVVVPGDYQRGPIGDWRKAVRLPPATAGLVFTAMPAGTFSSYEDVAGWLYGQAKQAEPAITNLLRNEASEHFGEMQGLNFRFKEPDSIARKLQTKGVDPTSAFDPFEKVKDALRYTIALPEPDWGNGVQNILWEIQNAGYRITEEENTWARGDSYSGLHYNFQTPTGLVFEVQFHTASSYDLKDKVLHQMYEEFRNPATPLQRRQQLYDEMTKYWDQIPIPDNALAFPGEKKYLRPVALLGSSDDFGTARPVSIDPTLAERPAYAMVRDMLADGDTPGEVIATLIALGAADAPGLLAEAMNARPFSALVDGILTQVLDLFDDGTVQTARGVVPAAEVLYPTYHPTRGLTAALNSARTAAALPEGYTLQYTRGGNVTNFSVAAIFEGKVVGAIQWVPAREVWGGQRQPDGSIESVLIQRPPQIVDLKVQPEHQRKGLATAMYEEAKRHEPNLVHDDIILPDGEAWMRSLSSSKTAGTVDAVVSSVVDDALDTISFASDLGLVDADAVRWYSASDAGQAAAEADLVGWGAQAELHEEPEPALPTTTGEDEDEQPDEQHTAAEAQIEAAGSVQDVVAAFQRSAGAQYGNGSGGGSSARAQAGDDMQIAAAARAFLAEDGGLQKAALKDFSPAEQKQIIDEGAEAGVVAANLASLDIAGTHYESLEAAFREAEAELPDEEWLY